MTLSNKQLTCQLTESELVDRGRRLALKLKKIDALKERLKHISARVREKTEKLSDEAGELRDAIESRSEIRWVECETAVDGGQTVVTRLDTGEVVEKRAASVAEMQTSLPMVGKARGSN